MTSPPYHWTIKQYFAQRWPSWLALLAVPFAGIVPVGTQYFLMGVIFYPWQRSLYFRSIQEFGGRSTEPLLTDVKLEG